MQLLTLFYIQIDLINHFIFSEFVGVFLFINDYLVTILKFFEFYSLCLVFTFFILGTRNIQGAR